MRRGLASLPTSSSGPFGRSADPSFVLCNYFKEWNSMLGGHFSAPIDTGSGLVLGLAVCTAFIVGELWRVQKYCSHLQISPTDLYVILSKDRDFIHCNIIIGTNIDFICKSYVILSIRYIPRNSVGKSYWFCSFYIEFIGFTHGIPRYITDRQNYKGFTYIYL